MDGIVEYLREGLEGSQTVIGRTVITLKDPNDMYFTPRILHSGSYLEEGQEVVISVSGAQGGEYEAVPEFADDGAALRFVLTGDDASSVSIAEGTTGIITVELAKRKMCLRADRSCTQRGRDVSYVYVVDDDGYRKVQRGDRWPCR